ncbi:MAG: TetR family transcriptional regulator [Actinomycetota bacterium]|nr:TetR family transcriptional regulator [Actinomycetota bacterium]
MRQARAEHTRTAIIEAALSLFAEKGFDATTMRAISQRAGVSLGSAYYYFESKEQLIQGFYDQTAVVHGSELPARLDGITGFGDRLVAHLDLWLDLMAPHHPFAVTFFRNAADPASPLSPFSSASAPARESAVALLRQVIEGSDLKAGADVRAELPELLWLFHMGVVLFWVYDRSDSAMATRLLVRRTVPMVERAVALSRLPVLRATINDLIALVGDLKLMMGGVGATTAGQTSGQG